MTREDHRIRVAGDGMAAWLYRPDSAGHPVPGVVLLHGFTATRDDRIDAFCERFAAAGFAALAFDFRHLGSSGGEPRQLIDLGRQYEDCDAALDFMRAQPGIDGDRVVIWGTSFAGGHALDAAARNRWLAAAICLVPFLDGLPPPPGLTARGAVWTAGVALRDLVLKSVGRDPYLVRAIGPAGSRAAIANDAAWERLPRIIPRHSRWRNEVAPRFVLQLPRHRPVKRAASVSCPLLVQVADGDTMVWTGPAVEAADKAPRGELRRYEGADHFDPYLAPLFDTVVDDQIAFLAKHVGARDDRSPVERAVDV